MLIDDDLVVVAITAARNEMAHWRMKPTPIRGSDVVFVHDAERPADPDNPRGAYVEYRCGGKQEAMDLTANLAWRAGLQAAVDFDAARLEGATKQ